MTRLYRVEHIENGRGPYNIGIDMGDLNYHTSNFNRPIPLEDGINNVPEHYHFGFKSLQQLYDWFGEFYEALKDEFHIVVYETENFIEGQFQVCFDKSATVVEHLLLEKENNYGY